MKLTWIAGAIFLFILGIVLTVTIIGAIIGIPLIILSIFIALLGILLPKKLIGTTIKLIFKIISAGLIIFIVFASISLISDSGKGFWNKNVLFPIMKPFSEECGYKTETFSQKCECDGTLFKGENQDYCYGTCLECSCSELNLETNLFEATACEQ